MIKQDVVERLVGSEAVDRAHTPIGRVHQVYLDEYVSVPTWVSIQLADDGEVLVPLEGADLDEEGLHVAFTEAQVTGVPTVPADLPPSDASQELLYEYYGLGVSYSVHDDEDDDVVFEAVEIDPEADGRYPR